jgi:cellulose synthase/poly-beta-1,6-N-acetylglucosamine synthase-like glycosyltransferase
MYQHALPAVFWACTALVVYSYLVYPVVAWALARLFGRYLPPPPVPEDDLPALSLLLAAFNEETVIADRLENALATDYPAGKFEVLVGSDGSTDRTAELVRRFADRGVRLFDFAANRGKSAVLNDLVAEAHGKVILMSDANTHVEPGAARKLVRWFRDPHVGAAVGRLVLTDPRTGRNVDSLYWKYETFLKRCEGRLGALLGANGAIYAIRRGLYEPLPPAVLIDDFVIPLLAKRRTGCAIVYDGEATAAEEAPPGFGCEFRRRTRIGAGAYQSLGMLWPLLSPASGWAAFTFLSHKVLRWAGPLLLIGAFASSLLLWGDPLYRALWRTQAGLYLTALLVAVAPARYRVPRLLRVVSMFAILNLALLVGLWRWLFRPSAGTWRRTLRPAEVDAAHR